MFDVQYQEGAQRILLRALAGGRMPHAYVFHGPTGVGKRMLADRLAMLLLCGARRAIEPPAEVAGALAGVACVDACGSCDDCAAVQAETHPDVHVITRNLRHYHPDAAVRGRLGVDLGIDVVRHFLIDAAGRRPMRGRAKVFIVEEAERMSVEAQNAMLKTLEEPPPTTYIVLLVRSEDRLLPTTRSRCQLVPFRALPAEFVEAKLRALRPALGAEAAGYLARLAEGQIGVAAAYADDGLFEAKREIGVGLASLGPAGVSGFASVVVDLAKEYGKRANERQDGELSDTEARRVGLRALLAAVGAFYTDALRRVGGAAGLAPINGDQPEVVEAVARRHTLRGLAQAIREVAAAESNIGRSANVQLALESLAIRLAGCG